MIIMSQVFGANHMTTQMTVMPYESGSQKYASGTQMILIAIENL